MLDFPRISYGSQYSIATGTVLVSLFLCLLSVFSSCHSLQIYLVTASLFSNEEFLKG